MLLINTRPAERADALNAALLQAGHTVCTLPLLELEACPLTEHLQGCYRQLPDVQSIVVVSPTAVEIGMQYLQQMHIQVPQLNAKWIAVGQTTAECLRAYGIDAQVPEVETSEGMLSLPILTQLAQKSRVAFWRGEGGRQFMMQQLTEAGMQIINFVLYRRRCPPGTVQQLQQLLQQGVLSQTSSVLSPVVLISSEASWSNWLDVCHQAHTNLSDHAHYVVLGGRVLQLLQQYQQQHSSHFKISKLTSLQPAAVLQLLAQL